MIETIQIIYFLGLPVVAWYDARGSKKDDINPVAVLLWPLLVVGVCVMMAVDTGWPPSPYEIGSSPNRSLALPIARAVKLRTGTDV